MLTAQDCIGFEQHMQSLDSERVCTSMTVLFLVCRGWVIWSCYADLLVAMPVFSQARSLVLGSNVVSDLAWMDIAFRRCLRHLRIRHEKTMQTNDMIDIVSLLLLLPLTFIWRQLTSYRLYGDHFSWIHQKVDFRSEPSYC